MFVHVYTVVAKFINCQQKLQVYFMLQTFKSDLATYHGVRYAICWDDPEKKWRPH